MNAIALMIPETVMRTVGWALLHAAWQGALIALLLGAALFVLRRSSASLRYSAGIAALACMLVLPVITALFVFPAISLTDAPASGETVVSSNPVNTTWLLGRDLASVATTSEPSGIVNARSLESLFPALLLVWLCGVGILSIRNIGGLFMARRWVLRDTKPAPHLWQVRLAALKQRLSVSAPVRLLESARVGVPTVIGWWKPVILVPTSAFLGMDAEQLEAVLAHELAHIRRHDYLVNLLQTVAETLLFFHPAVWWVSARIRDEREHCCDDAAAQACGDPKLVARALARLEEIRAARSAFAMAADGGSLLHRVLRLTGSQHGAPRRPVGAWASMMLVALVVLAGLGWQAEARLAPQAQRAGYSVAPVIAAVPGAEVYTVSNGALAAVAPVAVAVVEPTPPPAPAPRPAPQAEPAPEPSPAPAPRPAPAAPPAPSVRAYSSQSGFGYSFDTNDLAQAPKASSGTTMWSHMEGEGTWDSRLEGDWIGVSMRSSRHGGGSNNTWFSIPAEGLESVFEGNEVDLDLVRDAGTLHFVGEVTERGSRPRAEGTWSFTPNPEYTQAMRDLGYTLDDKEQLGLAMFDVRLTDIRELHALGYSGISLERIVEFKIHGVTPEYVYEMRDLVGTPSNADKFVEMRIHGLTPAYAQGMHTRFPRATADKLIEARIHGVTLDLVEDLDAAGYDDLTLDEVIELRIHGQDRLLLRKKTRQGD